MASFGTIPNRLVQGTNENTFALASVNFDFSLVSLAAPTEFTGVGSCLNHSHRENAEHGALHRTARKLGALFEGVVPPAPRLISAYGKRASEIMRIPELNPTGEAEKHGPFAAFVGADAASIWAAATSGAPSIAVHLLGCLLARAFSDPAKSTSALAELVHERQREIKREANASSSTASHVDALMATEQPIQREELQQWDTSARAWLQTADSAMQKECVQLKLILQNISLPVSSGTSLYDGVVRAWCQAMDGLERLLNGEPQNVTDGAILLAVSAWHIYPNLLVLSSESVEVDFDDRLLQSSGLLTVAINTVEDSPDGKDGLHWSMALSRYKYYGRALKAVGEIDHRLTVEQLHLVAFGSLMQGWNVPRNSMESMAKWMMALKDCLGRTKPSLGCPSWLSSLAEAARVILDLDRAGNDEALALIDFGQRRGSNFLHPRDQPCLPWFGLRFRHIVGALSAQTPTESAVEYLRSVARAGHLSFDEALITYIAGIATPTGNKLSMHEYYTAITPENDLGDNNLQKSIQVDNVNDVPQLEDDYPATGPITQSTSKMPEAGGNDGDQLPLYAAVEGHQTWKGCFSDEDYNDIYVGRLRTRTFTPVRIHDGSVYEYEPGLGSSGHNLASLNPSLPAPLLCDEYSSPNIGELFINSSAILPDNLGWFSSNLVRFKKYMGDPNGTMRLWLRDGRAVDDCDKITNQIESLQSGASAELLDIETATTMLEEGGDLDPLLVWQYLEGADPYAPDRAFKEVLWLMRKERGQFETTLKSLRSLDWANKVYDSLDGAKVSSCVVERGLYDVKWASSSWHTPATLAMAFSCIAFMDTGKVSLDPESLEQVIALSSGNSLFVSTRLLTDPFDELDETAVTRIVGNVGAPGVSLLIPPAASPLTSSLSPERGAVTYASFNGRREDNFKGTTLQLSLTSQRLPLAYGVSGIIDHQVFFVESVIMVHDSGQWVADLDILEAFNITEANRVRIPRRRLQKTCTHPEGMLDSVLDAITSVDTWEDVLDTCPGVNIIRAHHNWMARLAMSVMLSKTRDRHAGNDEDSDSQDLMVARMSQKWGRFAILENGDDVCWVCLHRRLAKVAKIDASDPFYIIA
ncbi:hypothetical protein KVR01_007692 [Diaporthe batatas]|uniref:uncharacterized protein n=1 Tax=Diaporthe batatas TaxID=748121 RepID=UPI001D04154C|nr:uncharacterized protein KVR01_007692 [Diaporthe batatas]KAG8161927.1 hypothetical protein KVR01_007692 [Diaporthe batatas]